MSSSADPSLFASAPRAQRSSVAALGLAFAALLLNAWSQELRSSLVCAGLGVALLVLSQLQGRRRLRPLLAAAASIVGLALLGGAALGLERAAVAATALRMFGGVVWMLWLGTQLDWSSLRRLLLDARLPAELVGALDHAVLHGLLTQAEWGRRRDAAQLRLGRASLPLQAWSQLLAEGALAALERVEQVEAQALLRGAAPEAAAAPQGCTLDAVELEREGEVILRPLSLALAPGEWIALCGPSGAGKSSVLRLLAGSLPPSRGQLTRLGRQLRAETPLRRRLDGRVALLCQNPEHHFIASTVAEDIAWGLRFRGVDPATAAKRLQSVAEGLGIAHLLERPCHRLSFGEQRRVALAGLLVLEPALLLLDEPTAGLDPVAAHDLIERVRLVLACTGAACVWATHDLAALPAEIARVVLLRDAAVVFDGPTAEGLSPAWLQRAGLAVEPSALNAGLIKSNQKESV